MEHLPRSYITALNMSGEIYWIDDKTGKVPEGAIKDRIEAVCGATIRDFKATQGTLDEILTRLSKEDAPKLIVLDYWLSSLPNDKDAGTRTEYGSTWAAELRADYPQLPIVGVSNESIKDVPDNRKSQFLRLLDHDQVFDGKHDCNLRALIDGFPEVFGMWSSVAKAQPDPPALPSRMSVPEARIVELFKSDPGSQSDLLAILPEFSKQPWDEETPHEFSRWIIDSFMGRPGFLYDSLEVATLLGLSEKGFDSVRGKFDEALYVGIYSSNDLPRWWVDRVRPIFLRILEADISGPMRLNGKLLLESLGLKAEPELLSLAHPGDDRDAVPDVVAFADEQRILSNRVQARMADTEADPLESPPLGFEARRIWAGKH
jgi:hypothetical protein